MRPGSHRWRRWWEARRAEKAGRKVRVQSIGRRHSPPRAAPPKPLCRISLLVVMIVRAAWRPVMGGMGAGGRNEVQTCALGFQPVKPTKQQGRDEWVGGCQGAAEAGRLTVRWSEQERGRAERPFCHLTRGLVDMGREESVVATCSRERMAHGDAASY
jgi:hypothetical protein